MNVLIVNNQKAHSGIGRYVSSLFSVLKRLHDCDVELLTWNRRFYDVLQDRSKGHNLFFYSEELLKAFSLLLFPLRLPRSYKLYHISNHMMSSLTRRLHPCVITVHDLRPFILPLLPMDFVIKKSMKDLVYADKIICVSEQTRRDLLRLLDVDPNVVSVIYHGVDHNAFRPRSKERTRQMLNLPTDSTIMLHVGTEEPRKNANALIKILQGLRKELPNTILVRLGDSAMATSKLIKILNLERKVLYFKELSVAKMKYLYNAADVFLFPSYYEGFGMPLLEAMASGCPVIASNKTSIPEVIGGAGTLLDPGDVDGFVYWAREVLMNPETRTKMIQRGLERSKVFTWEKCATETLQIYGHILEENAPHLKKTIV